MPIDLGARLDRNVYTTGPAVARLGARDVGGRRVEVGSRGGADETLAERENRGEEAEDAKPVAVRT